MQLSRADLLRSYRTMRTIREFEERIHLEFPTGEMAGFVQPLLTVWGADDRIIPVSHIKSLPSTASAHILENVGHMPHLEAAAEVNGLLSEFIEKLS